MEEEVKIELRDGKKIYGVLHRSKEDKKLVIFVHGLTGHKNEHQFFNAAPVFAEQGYSSYRLDLYNYEEDARELLDCTVDTHSEDLDDVIEYYKDKYKYNDIYLVGHSIGGPTIIFASHENVKAMALWDPSFEIYENVKMYATYNKELDKFVLNWGNDYLVTNEYIDSLKKVNKAQIHLIDIPSLLVFAEKSELEERWKPYVDDIKAEHEVVVLKDTDHNFHRRGSEEELWQATLNWFNKII